jgi:predicted nucleic acid-binding protein
MKKIFVDTNVIIDVLADRKPFSKFAIDLFKKAEKKKVKLYTSSHSLATTHYLLKKYMDEQDLRVLLYNLLDFITIVAVDVDVIKKGLRSKHKDFEDAIQINCAHTIEHLDCIVTRNPKDFRYAEVPVLSPEELF